MTHNSNKEQQVIDFLMSLAKKKRSEITHIQTTINLIETKRLEFTGLNDPILAQIHPATQIAAKERKVLLPVKDFLPFGKLDVKIAHVLSLIGSGFKEDILREIIQRQPELKARKLEPLLAVRLSYLIKNDLIAAEKFGRRYKYNLFVTEDL